MSFVRTPAKSEVAGWDVSTLANYMKRLDLKGCDKVVKIHNIDGSKFLNMSNSELQKFPKPALINRLRNDINQKDQKQGYFQKTSPSHKYQAQAQKQQCFSSQESDDSDHDYESPDSGNEGPVEEDYVCPVGERPSESVNSDNEYEELPSTEMLPQFHLKKPQDDRDYIDVPQRPSQVQAVRIPGPGPSVSPLSLTILGVPSPRQSQSTPFKPPAHSAPKVDRRTKPQRLRDSQCKDLQYPNYPSLSGTKPGGTNKDLDPSWYLGQVTRGDAESCLRRVRKDGAFLVRDSSTSSSTQPYTLMVLYQDKVYNIQIRYNGDQKTFSLGTGLNSNENFKNVGTIIQHHMQIPLNLIDANYHGPRRYCPLLYPAVLQY